MTQHCVLKIVPLRKITFYDFENGLLLIGSSLIPNSILSNNLINKNVQHNDFKYFVFSTYENNMVNK